MRKMVKGSQPLEDATKTTTVDETMRVRADETASQPKNLSAMAGEEGEVYGASSQVSEAGASWVRLDQINGGANV